MADGDKDTDDMATESAAPAGMGEPAADEAAVDAAAEGKRESLAQIFGEIAWMLTRSPGHRHFFIGDMDWLILAPVARSQFRLYRDEERKPVGLVLWAYLNEENEERLKAGGTRLRPDDWASGDKLWIIEVVDLLGGRTDAMLSDVKDNVFKDKPFSLQRVSKDGKRETVTIS